MAWNWLRHITDWIRGQFGAKVLPRPVNHRLSLDKQIRLLHYFDGEGLSPYPGVCGVWGLQQVRVEIPVYLAILVNIAQFRTASQEEDPLPEIQWRRSFEVRATAELKLQRAINGSHLILIGRVGEVQERRGSAGVQAYRVVRCTAVFKVDLQGMRGLYMEANAPAVRVLIASMSRLLNHHLYPDHEQVWLFRDRVLDPTWDWEERMDRVDWLEVVRFYACLSPHTRVDIDHNLQPPKIVGPPPPSQRRYLNPGIPNPPRPNYNPQEPHHGDTPASQPTPDPQPDQSDPNP